MSSFGGGFNVASDGIKAFILEYHHAIPKYVHLTPHSLFNVMHLKYADWFKKLSHSDVVELLEELDETLIKIDIDPYADISIQYQFMASKVFNQFLSTMRGHQDKKTSPGFIAHVLEKTFADVYGKTKVNDKQLNKIAARIVLRLSKMGYKF